jgi:hypothetical protein
VSLDRAGVARVVSAVLAVVPESDFRLVGSASSVVRGIRMPAADIDVLLRERSVVDAWCAALGEQHLVTGPMWIDGASQYFATVDIDGERLELSTVEAPTEAETMECVGSGPWSHFDRVQCGTSTVPGVASELRLLTEVARGRTARWQSIAHFLARGPFDRALVERGFAEHEIPADVTTQVLAIISPASAPTR